MSRKTEKISFKNSRGFALAGVLDMPADAAPSFYAVFAPCFTCLKESHGAVKISRALVERGGAVLRFDVTGLGGSEGNFKDTNFTTRIDDIVSACHALAEHTGHAADILIGHSISGTSALAAAKKLPQTRIIATIGSPSDPASVMDKFEQNNFVTYFDDRIEIDVLGHKTPFDLSFPTDLRSHNVDTDTAEIHQHLYIFHAPNDNIVKHMHAGIIHDRAGNAASRQVVTLDDAATHLFEKRQEDAIYIADILAAAAKQT